MLIPQLKSYLKHQRGAVFLLFATAFLPIVLVSTAIAINVATIQVQKTQLQNAADAAALAGASQYGSASDTGTITANINSYVSSYVGKNTFNAAIGDTPNATDFPNDTHTININITQGTRNTAKTVTVDLRRKVPLYFFGLHFLQDFTTINIAVRATAKYVPTTTATPFSIFSEGPFKDNILFAGSTNQSSINIVSPNITLNLGNVRTNGKIDLYERKENSNIKLTGQVNSTSVNVYSPYAPDQAWANIVQVGGWNPGDIPIYEVKGFDINSINYVTKLEYDTSGKPYYLQYPITGSQNITNINYSANTDMADINTYINTILNNSSPSNITSNWWDDKNEYGGNNITKTDNPYSPPTITASTGTQVYYTSGSIELKSATSTYPNDGVTKVMLYNAGVTPWAARYYNVVIANGDINFSGNTANTKNSPFIVVSLNGNINLHNSTDFYGYVYAPKGNIRVDVGGTVYGSLVGNTIYISSAGQIINYQSFADSSGSSGGGSSSSASSVSLIPDS
ncbi:pilus assembly protein TadG-related protein [Megasphaera paucivorans]|uniref:Putative Flp pilus-assembly TadE/G-like n=1 Tax=Megasphaera paucivorans TaxID=349095 RepID=A0A1G9WL79_9FIRM|nr:pilus assembly protein TadG-related protein [Megasphaera paucivorans]SDM85298.1 Putative Flp pilus-assembly TadE/G-like [Megasphaera paucivorans]